MVLGVLLFLILLIKRVCSARLEESEKKTLLSVRRPQRHTTNIKKEKKIKNQKRDRIKMTRNSKTRRFHTIEHKCGCECDVSWLLRHTSQHFVTTAHRFLFLMSMLLKHRKSIFSKINWFICHNVNFR